MLVSCTSTDRVRRSGTVGQRAQGSHDGWESNRADGMEEVWGDG